jgi:hypothetical protein
MSGMCIDSLARLGMAQRPVRTCSQHYLLLYCGSRQRLKHLHAHGAHVELSCPTPWPYSLKGTHVGCVWPKRAPSDSYYLSLGEWPRLPFTARIEGPPFHHGASASKKNGLATPSLLLNDHEQLVTKTYGKWDDSRFFLSNAVCPYSLSLILARRVCDLSRLPLHDR